MRKIYSWFKRNITAQKMKFSFNDFFSKCDQISSFLRIWSYLMKKSLMENFTFCIMYVLSEHKLLTKGVRICKKKANSSYYRSDRSEKVLSVNPNGIRRLHPAVCCLIKWGSSKDVVVRYYRATRNNSFGSNYGSLLTIVTAIFE